jgi:hypothetical protein
VIWILLVAYQVKHFLADYPLQTPYMLRKFLPGWDFVRPLAAHAGTHAGFTFVIALAATFTRPYGLPISVGCAALDFTVHFIVDRIKASPQMLGRFKALSAAEFKSASAPQIRANTYFWWALGWDQAMHHLTHYLIIWILLG